MADNIQNSVNAIDPLVPIIPNIQNPVNGNPPVPIPNIQNQGNGSNPNAQNIPQNIPNVNRPIHIIPPMQNLPRNIHGNIETPQEKLFRLVRENRYDKVDGMISNGDVSPNVQNDNGMTALHLARSKEMIRALIDNGANRHIRDNLGRKPEDLLHEEMRRFIREYIALPYRKKYLKYKMKYLKLRKKFKY